METNKVISALSYFSVFFAPLIVPIIIYFVSDDSFVKKHAKSSLISHIIPALYIPFLIGAFIYDVGQSSEFPAVFLIFMALFLILNIVIFIWNIVRGVKLLVK
ncbi:MULTISPECIES: DUF4870 domain-containing protein [Bacillus]|uniref:DUF4870 domain-containing protein n=1 Tax=Bacillus TaxID=1386 RepID=UPI0002E7CA53|nr:MULTISPECIES: DUF4870 domain-containing protein [Bacillus]